MLSLFYFLRIISALVTNMSFIKALFRLRICLFRYVFCRRKSSETCYFSSVLTLLFLTIMSVSHIYCWQIAHFHCVSLSHRGCLIWSNLSQFRSKNLKASLPSSTRVLFSDEARCFSQSECSLYGNSIMILGFTWQWSCWQEIPSSYQFFYSIYLQGEPIITRQSWWYL